MDDDHSEPTRKRLRTSHACDGCRARKIRCNGNAPCAACLAADQECTYGSEANSRGKSDLILEGVLRVEKFLHEMLSASASTAASPSPLVDRRPSQPVNAFPMTRSFSGSPLVESHPRPRQYSQSHHAQIHSPLADEYVANNLENAVLDSMHTSTTESILHWPHFEAFPTLRRDYVSIFQLEQSRPSVRTRSRPMYPYIAPHDADAVLDAFSHAVNFWYPTMSRDQLDGVRELVVDEAGVKGEGIEADTPSACLALLAMALGCASQVVGGLAEAGLTMSEEERQWRAGRRAVGDLYFDAVLGKVHCAHTEVSSAATQCLFFMAMYFAFLRRPLQAWEYISAAAAKCLLLLSYPPANETDEDHERIRRIFWSCYILESDYLAELSALPQSGIARIESSVPLPGAYRTHASPREEEQSSLYFLACISMRRLLNRVHNLLYAAGTGAARDRQRFPAVVAELVHQLDEWRAVLPPALAFRVGFGPDWECEGKAPATTVHGGFLRQRYLTCRSVIYRPYLMWMLNWGVVSRGVQDKARNGIGGRGEGDDVLDSCKACLDACLLHILNLRGFAHTVLVDTWICSLSMAGAMLIILAACRIPALRDLIERDVLTAGVHLRDLLEGWQAVAGDPTSPSVDQSVRIIGEADRFIRQVYDGGGAVSPEIAGEGTLVLTRRKSGR